MQNASLISGMSQLRTSLLLRRLRFLLAKPAPQRRKRKPKARASTVAPPPPALVPQTPCTAVVSHVRTFPVVGRVMASMARSLGFGLSTEGSSQRAGQGGSSSRTARSSSDGVWLSSSQTLPRSGTLFGGTVFPLLPSAPLTCGIASSSSRGWPTPLALYWVPKDRESILARLKPESRHAPTIGEAVFALHNGTVSLDWLDSVMGFPPGYTKVHVRRKPRARQPRRPVSASATE